MHIRPSYTFYIHMYMEPISDSFVTRLLAASAASEDIIIVPDTSSNINESKTPAIRRQDMAEGEESWTGHEEEPPRLTLSRPPRAGRSERQAEEDQVDRCRLFVEGDPTKNELYSPEYPNLYPKNINCTRVIVGESWHILMPRQLIHLIGKRIKPTIRDNYHS